MWQYESCFFCNGYKSQFQMISEVSALPVQSGTLNIIDRRSVTKKFWWEAQSETEYVQSRKFKIYNFYLGNLLRIVIMLRNRALLTEQLH